MFGKQLFEEVSSKISETIANSPAKAMEKNVKTMTRQRVQPHGFGDPRRIRHPTTGFD